MFTPNLGVNDVHERPSRASAGAAMFTGVDHVHDVIEGDFSARIGPFPLPAALGSSRRIHVNDSNPQCWRVVYTNG